MISELLSKIEHGWELDYRVLFESVPGLYLIISPDFKIIGVNDAYMHATLTKRSEIVGRHLFEVFPDNPDDPAATGTYNLRASIQRALKNGVADVMAIQKYDIRRQAEDGGGFEERYWSPVNTPIFNDHGKIVCIIHSAKDVTDFVKLRQKDGQAQLGVDLGLSSEAVAAELFQHTEDMAQAKQKLHESQERYELAVKGARDGLWDWNVLTDELYWSDRFKEMLEITTDSFRPHYDEFKKRLHPDDYDRIITELEAHTKTRAAYDSEFRMYTDTGKLIWMRARGASVWDSGNMATRMTGSVTDITSQKQAEEAVKYSQNLLKASEERYELALKGSNDGLWDLNVATGEIYWSDRLREMMGVNQDFRPSFDDFQRRIHPDDMGRVMGARDKHAAQYTTYDIEYRVRTNLGNYIWLRDRGRGIWDEAGNMVRMLGSITDITDKKYAEEELKAAREQADKASKTKSEFLANMSHELRTPLNSVIGLTRMLYKDKDITEEHREMAGVAYRSAENLLDIVNDILDLSKVESGNLVLEKITFSLQEIMDNVMETMLPLSSEKGLIFSYDLDCKNSYYLVGDPVRLGRVMINLTSNAIKYTEEGAVTVTIRCIEQDNTSCVVECSVIDTGIGIPADKIDLIFDKFIQADSSITRRYGGTGLGLAITKQIVEKMGGEIGVESEVGKGSRFWFRITFPTAETRPVIDRGAFRREKYIRLPDEDRKNIKNVNLLVAEDHLLNQILLRKLLPRMGFNHFDIMENGKAILEAMRSKTYDMILMDCHMPVMSGYDATKEIRIQEQGKARIPIIAMTADAMIGTRERCLEVGMDDYISKPLNPDELRYIFERWVTFADEIGERAVNEDESDSEEDYDLTLLNQFASNEEDSRRFIEIFLEQSDHILTLLQKYCRDGECNDWVEAAHKLKGGAAMIKAKRLSHLAAQAQAMRHASSFERKKILTRIEAAYENVRVKIQEEFPIRK